MVVNRSEAKYFIVWLNPSKDFELTLLVSIKCCHKNSNKSKTKSKQS